MDHTKPTKSNGPENDGVPWVIIVLMLFGVIYMINGWCEKMGEAQAPDIIWLTLCNFVVIFIFGIILLAEDYGCFALCLISVAFGVGILTAVGVETSTIITRLILISTLVLFIISPILWYLLKIKMDKQARQQQAEYSERQKQE